MSASPDRFLREVLLAIKSREGTAAAAIWLRNAEGFLQLKCESNINDVGIDDIQNGRQNHNELLRRAFYGAKPVALRPSRRLGISAVNATRHVVYIAPLLLNSDSPFGLLECWNLPVRDARLDHISLSALARIAGRVSKWFCERGDTA